jgi:ABC-type polysaccharide/polyol phosphate transport system ATPase subunit
MSIEFRNVSIGPLKNFSAAIPAGTILGVIGDRLSGANELIKLIAGSTTGEFTPETGEVLVGETPVRYVGVTDPLQLSPVKVLILDHTLSLQDAIVRGRTLVALERMRQTGTTIVIASHEAALLRTICTEAWWIREGRLVASGDPQEILDWYAHHITQKLNAWGATLNPPVQAAKWIY